MSQLASLARNRVLLACAAVACAAAALAGGEIAGGAVRAMALVSVLAIAAVAVRRGRTASLAAPVVAVTERHVFAKDTGIALVTLDQRRFLIGYGPGGVALVAELPCSPEGAQR